MRTFRTATSTTRTRCPSPARDSAPWPQRSASCPDGRMTPDAPPPQPLHIIGLGWLYALHARSCIARQKLWQAEYMISGIRDHAFVLACIRHGLPAVHGRGIDQLPSGVTAQLESSLVRQLNVVELLRAFRVVVDGLLSEIRSADSELAGRLQEALTYLTESPR